jgi:acetylcholinesterase
VSTLFEGTIFVPQNVNSTQEILSSIIAEYTSSAAGQDALASAANHILQLYPDDPAQGSPFNTGNETFGRSSQYKRYSAICNIFMSKRGRTTYLFPVHDIHFEAQRRLFNLQVARHGRKSFAYSFQDTDARAGSLGSESEHLL